jgi:hypothetical protein
MATNNALDFNTLQQYLTTCSRGLETMRNSSVVICSMVRDAEAYLPHTTTLLFNLAHLFKSYHIILYENDSVDSTKELLRNLGEDNKNVTVISENLNLPKLGAGTDEFRVNAMAHMRNRYLDVVKSEFLTTDFLIVLDADIKVVDFNGIAQSFGLSPWDIMTSNGLDVYKNELIYYDIFTLVKDNVLMNGVIHLPFKPFTDLEKVDSAFGGLAIYRTEVVKDCKYEVRLMNGQPCAWHPDIRHACEHVGLNLSIKEKGFDKIYINPNQIVIR